MPDKTLEERVRAANEEYFRTGSYPAQLVFDILGDPVKGVEIPQPEEERPL